MFLNFGDDSASFCFDQLIKLRDQEFPCEFYPKPAKLKKQLNYANQRSIPYVVILGSEEMQKKVFVLKNMVSGDQEEHPIAQMFKVLQELN